MRKTNLKTFVGLTGRAFKSMAKARGFVECSQCGHMTYKDDLEQVTFVHSGNFYEMCVACSNRVEFQIQEGERDG